MTSAPKAGPPAPPAGNRTFAPCSAKPSTTARRHGITRSKADHSARTNPNIDINSQNALATSHLTLACENSARTSPMPGSAVSATAASPATTMKNAARLAIAGPSTPPSRAPAICGLRLAGDQSLTRVSEMIPAVRSFNRTVTERVGALVDGYLGRNRPLGASRVLWEGGAGTDVRALRARLRLDSGYMSRLLRGLEAEGLVTVRTDADDRRVRTVRLTPAGARERAHLDARSEALAASLLDPLSERRRAELIESMATVELLLTAGLVEIAPEAGEAAAYCVAQYFAELHERFGFDPAHSRPHDGSLFLV